MLLLEVVLDVVVVYFHVLPFTSTYFIRVGCTLYRLGIICESAPLLSRRSRIVGVDLLREKNIANWLVIGGWC